MGWEGGIDARASPEEMEELLSNEAAFDIFFHSLERVKNLRTFQEELLSGNEQLARKYLREGMAAMNSVVD